MEKFKAMKKKSEITEDDLKAEMTFSLQGGAKLTTTTYVDGVPTTKEGTLRHESRRLDHGSQRT